MAIIAVTSSPYTGVFRLNGPTSTRAVDPTGYDIGLTRNGFSLAWTIHEEPWRLSTSFGRSLIETIYCGADWSIAFVSREYGRVGTREALWPWGRNPSSSLRPVSPVLRRVGSRGTEHAGVLDLTSAFAGLAGVPGSLDPLLFTAEYALPVAGDGFRFDSTNREMAIRMNLLPYEGRTSSQAVTLDDNENSFYIWFTAA